MLSFDTSLETNKSSLVLFTPGWILHRSRLGLISRQIGAYIAPG